MSSSDTARTGTACPVSSRLSSPRLVRARTAGWVVAARLAFVGVASAALAGCFQPMYAAGTPETGNVGVREKLQDINVLEIPGRVGHELRNDLIYTFQGGGANPENAPLQLLVQTRISKSTALVNKRSGLPENEIVRLRADWRLVRADDEKKVPLVRGTSNGTATIDTSYQRFANYSASQDAEVRASRVVTEAIQTQLIGYFLRPAPTGK